MAVTKPQFILESVFGTVWVKVQAVSVSQVLGLPIYIHTLHTYAVQGR